MSVAWGKPRVPLCATCGSPNQNLRRQCDVCRALCVPDPIPDPHEAAALLAEYREEKAHG